MQCCLNFRIEGWNLKVCPKKCNCKRKKEQTLLSCVVVLPHCMLILDRHFLDVLLLVLAIDHSWPIGGPSNCQLEAVSKAHFKLLLQITTTKQTIAKSWKTPTLYLVKTRNRRTQAKVKAVLQDKVAKYTKSTHWSYTSAAVLTAYTPMMLCPFFDVVSK